MFKILNTKLCARALKTGIAAAIVAVAFSFSPVSVDKAEATSMVYNHHGYNNRHHYRNHRYRHHRQYRKRHYRKRHYRKHRAHRRYYRGHRSSFHFGFGGPRYYGGGYYDGGYYGGGYPVPVPVVRHVPVPQPVYCPIPVPVATPSYGGAGYGGGVAVGPVYQVFGPGGC